MPWEQGCDLVGAFNLFRVEDFAGRILSALDNITSVKCYSLEVQEIMSDRFLILSDPDEGFEFSVSSYQRFELSVIFIAFEFSVSSYQLLKNMCSL